MNRSLTSPPPPPPYAPSQVLRSPGTWATVPITVVSEDRFWTTAFSQLRRVLDHPTTIDLVPHLSGQCHLGAWEGLYHATVDVEEAKGTMVPQAYRQPNHSIIIDAIKVNSRRRYVSVDYRVPVNLAWIRKTRMKYFYTNAGVLVRVQIEWSFLKVAETERT